MARLAGFEPTTPWFVAKYSIQLSYSRKNCFFYCFNRTNRFQSYRTSPERPNWRGFRLQAVVFVAKYSIQLSYSRAKPWSLAVLTSPAKIASAPVG